MSANDTNTEQKDDNTEQDIRGAKWVGGRLVALIAGVAVFSLLLGVGVMQFIVSPADLAARTAAPKAGAITAAVEKRVIENAIVARGEITYADAVAVNINTESGDRPVVSGHVPEVGAVLEAGNVALEIAGRPVIVLPGELPAYRTLSIGMRGPDVAQLKSALSGFGWNAGNLETDLFEYDTAIALRALYEHVGYVPSTGGETASNALREAERAVRAAQNALAQAKSTLDDAKTLGNPTLGVEQAAVNTAVSGLRDAQSELSVAQEGALPRLPANEAAFLGGLPRRVDTVSVKRGDILSGSPMQVSGATLALSGTFSKKDADLLSVGSMAYYPGQDGVELPATVQRIEPLKTSTASEGKGDAGTTTDSTQGTGNAASNGKRYKVTFSLGKLTAPQIETLRGVNVRIRVPVSATEGEVLAVPVAALSAGAGGESRVELAVKKGDTSDDTELIPVETGLAAGGFVEISSADVRIEPGAKVVVGR